jgi:hypothetical protein
VHLSENTVKTHVQEIFRKLEVRNRVEAAIRATKEGLIQPGPAPRGSGEGPPANRRPHLSWKTQWLLLSLLLGMKASPCRLFIPAISGVLWPVAGSTPAHPMFVAPCSGLTEGSNGEVRGTLRLSG